MVIGISDTCWPQCCKLFIMERAPAVYEYFRAESEWWGMDRICGCRLFRQPLVPLVSAADGKWLVPQGLAPILKPGGHGAIWKLMLDEGVFSWLYQHGREAAIVRQIRHVPLPNILSSVLSTVCVRISISLPPPDRLHCWTSHCLVTFAVISSNSDLL